MPRLSRTACLGAALLTLGAAATAQALQIEGVQFSDSVTIAEQDLSLKGAGLLRYRIFFRGYVATYYEGDAADEAQPRRIEIEYFWGIPADEFRKATVEGIAKNHPGRETADFAPSIDALNALYRDVEAGDRYALTWVPGEGTRLDHNGRTLGSVPGDDFGAAVFDIWLGEEPFDEGLKRDLLGSGSATEGARDG